ncbi:MAG: Response regulator receiver protein [Pseudonocardiales bacterium]|nr:Response regulator receiver protein [Pseudonocardiales bacterium]
MNMPGSPPRPTTSVLLVEDDERDAVLVRACLDEAGIGPDAVIWARSLAAAAAALERGPGCVLLDLELPDVDGLSALLTVVEGSPDTPVIVLTGRHDPGGIDALAVGAQDYLVKDDITADLLGRSIRYAVERKRAQRTSQQLREARLSSAEKARLERGLLPRPLLRTDAVECSNYYQPGRDHAVLGGDFFDVVETSDGLVRAVIGDVMGHGPDEAALGVHLRVAWRTLVLAGTPDDQILPTLASLLKAESEGHPGFVTACDLTIDVDGATVAMRVAGHPAPLRCAHGKTTYLDVEIGPPLGVEAPGAEDATRYASTGWPETKSSLDPGSSLILYTDGLLDAYAVLADDASLGIEELVTAVTRCAIDGGAVASWIPSIVGSAPNASIDDTAVVVITTRSEPEH